MSLDLSTFFLSQLLDLAAHEAECAASDRGQPSVKVRIAGLADHYQLVLRGNCNIDPHAKRIPGSLVLLRFLYGHATANDVITDAFELCGLLADQRFDVRRFANVTESDLQRNLHKVTSNFICGGQRTRPLC